MKPEEFRRRKEKYEKAKKRQITDEEYERLLSRSAKFERITYAIAIIVALAIATEWPGPWAGVESKVVSYVGWAGVVMGVVGLIKDMLKKEGAFFKRE